MSFRNFFPRALVTSLAIGILSTSAYSQTRPRQTQPVDPNDVSCSIDDPAFIASTTAAEASKPAWEAKPAKPVIDVAPSVGSTTVVVPKLQPMLMAAIDERLGSP